MSYTLSGKSDQQAAGETWIPYKAVEIEKNDKTLRMEQLLHRIKDCSTALDLLDQLNDGILKQEVLYSTLDLSLFKGAINLTTPVIAGHSFGSSTVLRTLAANKRFKYTYTWK